MDSFDKIWIASIETIFENGFKINVIDKSSGLITADSGGNKLHSIISEKNGEMIQFILLLDKPDKAIIEAIFNTLKTKLSNDFEGTISGDIKIEATYGNSISTKSAKSYSLFRRYKEFKNWYKINPVPKPIDESNYHAWLLHVAWWTLKSSLWAFFIACLILLGTAVLVYKEFQNVENKNNKIIENQHTARKSEDEKNFYFLNTQYGDSVGLYKIIEGHTPYPKKKHYLIITSEVQQQDYLQPGVVTVNQYAKTFQCRGKFGDEQGHGLNEYFLIKVITTDSLIKTDENGVITDHPSDEIATEPVKVYRNK